VNPNALGSDLDQAVLGVFERDGFAILPRVLDDATLERFRDEADRLLRDSDDRGGVRNALGKSAISRDSTIAREIATSVLGPGTRLTKLTVFDKSPTANWTVPWHQDLTITVAERLDVEGFGPWSMKDGLPHVQAPVGILERIVAVRIHLDETPADNGALRVLAGTHHRGRLTANELRLLGEQSDETICPVALAGAMLMSPLLVHASRPAPWPARRRVLHYECCATPLPRGLAWA
jgi:ectoine hydroxylase-related dioxygenase (phytanoyl-CoA dioxygenase family)